MLDTPHREAESIGALLALVRTARGMSQLRLAELLCAASGVPTITRHEVSRWEREERIPSAYWLSWLAVALDVPADELEAAAAVARIRRADVAPPPDSPLWTPRDAADLLTALDRPASGDLLRLAHAWLAGGLDQRGALDRTGEQRRPADLDALAARLAELRRMDDLVGGVDLVTLVDRELRVAVARLAGGSARDARRRMRLVAEFAQLAGWVAGDAGRPAAARRAYRVGLWAASAAGDRTLAAHLLGSLSHLVAGSGQPREALLLAQTGYTGARRTAPAAAQALLLHRVAHAAALAGERRTSEHALAAAERAADRRDPARDPTWLYWLDGGELTAMAGRTFAALRRPLRAEPLLRANPCIAPRTAALNGSWLARAYLDAGESAQACVVAGDALLAAVRANSVRAATRALAPAPQLLGLRGLAEAQDYAELVAAARPYLPPAATARKAVTGAR